MEDLHRPPLGGDIYEAIELAQHEVDKQYWAELQPLRVSLFAELSETVGGPPSPPKRPIHLFKIVREYACALFDAEARNYPTARELPLWLLDLGKRIEVRVMKALRSGAGSTLLHHATKDEMEKEVHDVLTTHIEDCTSGFPGLISSLTSTAHKRDETLGEQIKKLSIESRLNVEKLAEAIDVSPRSVYRHLSGRDDPSKSHLDAYEKVFSAKLKKQVRLHSPLDVKRQ